MPRSNEATITVNIVGPSGQPLEEYISYIKKNIIGLAAELRNMELVELKPMRDFSFEKGETEPSRRKTFTCECSICKHLAADDVLAEKVAPAVAYREDSPFGFVDLRKVYGSWRKPADLSSPEERVLFIGKDGTQTVGRILSEKHRATLALAGWIERVPNIFIHC